MIVTVITNPVTEHWMVKLVVNVKTDVTPVTAAVIKQPILETDGFAVRHTEKVIVVTTNMLTDNKRAGWFYPRFFVGFNNSKSL